MSCNRSWPETNSYRSLYYVDTAIAYLCRDQSLAASGLLVPVVDLNRYSYSAAFFAKDFYYKLTFNSNSILGCLA